MRLWARSDWALVYDGLARAWRPKAQARACEPRDRRHAGREAATASHAGAVYEQVLPVLRTRLREVRVKRAAAKAALHGDVE